jgi:hypothetical protein
MKLKKDYRIAQQRVAKLSAEKRPWEAMDEVSTASALCPRSRRATLLKRLTPGQRAFLALGGLIGEVNNGGIHQYFWNSAGNDFPHVLAALKLVGASDYLRLLKKEVRELFRDMKGPLKSRRRRQKALAKVGTDETWRRFDNLFYKLERRKRKCLDGLLQAYFKKHPEEFLLPAGIAQEEIPQPKPGARDYRVPSRKVSNLRGEKLHWTLIQKLWDDYWEPLKKGKQQILDFLVALSRGQRALISIDILNKNVGTLEGFTQFLGNQAGVDVLASEVVAGFELLGARAYSDLFERVMAVAGDLPELNRKASDQHVIVEAAKKAGDEAAIEAARKTWYVAYQKKRAKADELADELHAFTDEYMALLKSEDQNIERFIEAYFEAHRDEFVC